jgi:hypothetical protein
VAFKMSLYDSIFDTLRQILFEKSNRNIELDINFDFKNGVV